MSDITDPRGMWVKVDGLTRPDDVEAACDAGVSAVGFIFAPSPRQVSVEQAQQLREHVSDGVRAFGVFAGTADVAPAVQRLSLGGVQLPGVAPPLPSDVIVLQTVRVRDVGDLFGLGSTPCDAIHIDAYVEGQLGGTGHRAPWDVIAKYRPRKPFVLSGGLSADNVAEAIRQLHPVGVDVSSGVEAAPGVKDHDKLRRFVEAARGAR